MDFQVSSSSEYGRFEQIVSQFLLKALHIVLESRIPSFKPQDHSGELLSNSKAKKTDKWFNLALGDRPASLEKLHFWHRNLMDPMVIDIIVVRRGADDSSGNELYYEQMFDAGGAVETVIERWVVQYESQKMMPVQTSDLSLLYKKMYQKSIILFRSLCSMMRHLPAYRIFKHLSSNQPSDIDIIYKVSSFSDPFSREQEQMMKQYSFNSVEAVSGRLCVLVTYRSNLSEFNLESPTAIPPVIITDYVGSPATDPMRAFPTMDTVSRQSSFTLRGSRNACSTPSQRPHSWSSGIQFPAAHMQNYPLGRSPPPYRGSSAQRDDPSSPTHIQGQRVQNYRMFGRHDKTNSYDESVSPPFSPSSSPSPPTHLRHSPSQSRLRLESAPVAIPYPMLNRSSRYLSPNLSDPNRIPLPPLSPKSTRQEPSPHGSPSPSGSRLYRKLDTSRPGELHSGMTNLSVGSKISRDSKDESGRFSGLLSSGSSPHKTYSRSSSRRSFQDDLDICDFSCPFDVDDVDTSDPQASQSAEAKKGSEFNAASLGRKSQDAEVGALVHMLRTAPPLRQDSSFYSSHSQSTSQQQGNFGTTSGFCMGRTASDALEELKSYREMKDMILSKSERLVSNTEGVKSMPLEIKGRRI